MLRLMPCFLLAALASLVSKAASHPCDAVTADDAYVCDPNNYRQFYRCLSSGQRYVFHCPEGQVFNNDVATCVRQTSGYVCPGSSSTTSGPSTTTSTATTTAPSPTTSTPTTTASSTAATTTADSSTTTVSTSPSPSSSSAPDSTTDSSGEGHPCDSVSAGSMVCNPAKDGTSFYWCTVPRFEFNCPLGLVFVADKQACDWKPAGYTCGGGSSASTTPVSTTVPAGTCDESNCVLPECLCEGNKIPRRPGQNHTAAQVPQMVLLTFDDAVNKNNFGYYDILFPANESKARKNPNGCRTSATFFVSGAWTNMAMVKTLADRGNELASHSMDHSWPNTWSYQQWVNQMQGMRQHMSTQTEVPTSKIVGMRAPFLELGGEHQFTMLTNYSFLYDSSMFGGYDKTAHPLWPFTLKYPPRKDGNRIEICDQLRCPAGSYPNIWEVPLVRQYHHVTGTPCSMTDAGCIGPGASKEDVYQYLLYNFNRHYMTNRSPFMISLHATWFTTVPNSFEGLEKFLDYASTKDDVWQVTLTQMLDWVRRPTPLTSPPGNVDLPSWQCAASSGDL